MAINTSNLDRTLRIVIGILAAFGGYKTGGTVGIMLYVVAALGLVTGVLGRCGIYKLLGINTCPVKK